MAKTIGEMRPGEIGYAVPWALGLWNWRPYPRHLNGLNLSYHVHPKSKGTRSLMICRVEGGWVVGRLFAEPEA
jgi:hypothetical protein